MRTGIQWNLASLVVLAVCGIALNILIGAFYSPATLGVFNQALAAYIVFAMFAVGGVNYAAIKLIAEAPEDDGRVHELAWSSVLLTLACSAVVTGAFWMVRGPIAGWLKSPDVRVALAWITPGLFCFGLNKTLLGIINGLHRMKTYAVFQALRYLNLLTGLLVAWLLHFPGERLAFVFSFSEGILLLSLLIMLRRYARPIAFRRWSRWIPVQIRFALKGVLSGALLELNSRVDVLMLGYFLSDAQTGIYSFAAFMFEGFLQIPVVLQQNYNPRLSRLLHAGRLDELRDVFRRGRRTAYRYALLAVPAIVLLYPLGVHSVFATQPAFWTSWLPFAILMGGLLAASGYLPFHNLLIMGGCPGWHTLFVTLTVIANIALNALLIPLLGLAGAALATATSLTLTNGTLTLLARRCLGTRLW